MQLKKKPFNSHVANVKDSAVELCGEDDAETPLAHLVRIGWNATAASVKSVIVGAFAATRSWGAVAIGFGASAGKAGVAIGYQAAASDAKMTVIGSCSDPTKIYFGDKSLAELIAAV